MRTAAWVAAIGSVALAQAAHADDNPSADAATMATSTAAVTAVRLVPALERVDLTTQMPHGDDPFDRVKGAIRHRFASQMIDLYPSSQSGFHFSVGTKFYRKQYIRRDQQLATNGLLYEPRMPRGGYGQRGFRRATAAATFGYTQAVVPNVMLGIEGGTLLGRAVQAAPRLARQPGEGSDAGDSNRRLNPVLNLTLAYAF